MEKERTAPLRARMVSHRQPSPVRGRWRTDMRIRGMGEKAQKAHIRAIKDFAAFLKRSPDTATPDDLRAYQLHMTDAGITPSTFNARIVALRFFFGMTCGREDMKRFMQFRTQPRRLPVVFSVEEVSDLLMAAPGPGIKYRAALRHQTTPTIQKVGRNAIAPRHSRDRRARLERFLDNPQLFLDRPVAPAPVMTSTVGWLSDISLCLGISPSLPAQAGCPVEMAASSGAALGRDRL